MSRRVDRRRFITMLGAGGAGLALGYIAPLKADEEDDHAAWNAAYTHDTQGDTEPWLWIRIEADAIRLVIPRCEMGQGTMTGLAMLMAEELDVAWSQVRTEFAIPGPDTLKPRYRNLATGNSSAIETLWRPLRESGAMARALLVAAAARQWDVPAEACTTREGIVLHAPSGRRVAYAELAEAAAALPLPEGVELKDEKDFTFIGRSMPRLDFPGKLNGRAVFGMDVRLPDMLVATVVQCPVYGGKLKSVDDAAALAVPGVRRVLHFRDESFRGQYVVAVVADGYWSALKGARALKLEWLTWRNDHWNDDKIRAFLGTQVDLKARRESLRGDGAVPLETADDVIEAEYTAPLLAHATMEPMVCTVHVTDDHCEVWVPTQHPADARRKAAAATGLPQDRVTVHMTYVGGGFGRRLLSDVTSQACYIAREFDVPVKLIWSREEDIKHDFYRPPTIHRMRAALDAEGYPLAWHHALGGTGSTVQLIQDVDVIPYAIPHKRVDWSRKRLPVIRTGPWRGVSRSHNSFVTECFLDELARRGGHDPFDYRRLLLRDAPRYRTVLETAAEKAGWGRQLPDGRHQGIALADEGGAICAQVAEVSIDENNRVRVHRLVCVADGGVIVHPDAVTAQVESAALYGLCAALHGKINIQDGRVRQSNFHDYRVLRMSESPEVEVYLIESLDHPLGMGEVGLPATAPAVANAVLAATGKPVRDLPIKL